jgi:anaerobic selenocysteine-containing dehydrogenase
VTSAAVEAQASFVRSICRCCTAGCGIIAEVHGGDLVSVRGDPGHPNSRGYLCPKGHELPWSHGRPDRLDHPLLGGERVTWAAALDDIAAKLRQVIDGHGPDAFGWFVGNGTASDHLGGAALQTLCGKLGSTRSYSAATIDIAPSWQLAEMVTGSYQLLPRWRWDDPDSRLVLWLGANPAVSHGYQTLMPDPVRRIRAFRGRGGQLWVADPRLTKTASLADHHLQIRPGTDHVLLAYLVQELISTGTVSAEFRASMSEGEAARLRRAVEPFGMERACAGTGLRAAELAALAGAIRSAGRIAVIIGTGITFQRDALLTEWLRWLLLLATGSLDKPGGMWFSPGWFQPFDAADQPSSRSTPELPRSPARPELSRVAGQLPAISIPDDADAGHLRGLFVSGGNIATSFPQPERVARSLGRLDMLVVLDVISSPTAALATHVLPVTGQMERMDVVQASSPRMMVAPRVVPPSGERRPVWWVAAQLGRRLGTDVLGGLDPDHVTEEELTRQYFRAGRQDLGDPVDAGPDGIALPVVHGYMAGRVLPGGRWRIFLPELVGRLEGKARGQDPDAAHLDFISGRRLRRNGSLDFVPSAKRSDRPEVFMHPADATARGLTAGELVLVTSGSGSVAAELALDPGLRLGSVTMNQGWAEANVSRLVSLYDGVDPLTGQPAMSALKVSVRSAHGDARTG